MEWSLWRWAAQFLSEAWLQVILACLAGFWLICSVLIPIFVFSLYRNIVRMRRETNKTLLRMDGRLETVERAASLQVEAGNAAYNAQFKRTA
ncbi:MAG: hypothetical protein NTV79_01860 [Candidatus Aureabacteria bacterium]|nr:hypothetical protein [Candidatus Auribacterota bacterium]